jgi:hypothetical protein
MSVETVPGMHGNQEPRTLPELLYIVQAAAAGVQVMTTLGTVDHGQGEKCQHMQRSLAVAGCICSLEG